MGQIFTNLPVPAANGAGTPVDMSAFGPLKTIAVSGGANCTINIEFSNDAAGLFWAPVCTIGPTGGTFQFVGACRWMRGRVSQYLGSITPVVNVGGTNEGSSFLDIPVPDADGSGTAVDVSSLGPLKTIQIGDTFRGSLQIDVSEDNGMNWATIASFSNPGAQTIIFAAKYMRVTRNGIPTINPGQPVCSVGATNVTPDDRGIAISAGTQMASSGTVQLKNSNGVSFGMSDSTGITASFDGMRSVLAGTATALGPQLSLSNANGVTFGITGSTLTASVQTAGGTATGVGISAGTQVATTGAVIFSNSNNVTFGLNNQTLTASVAPPLGIGAGTVTQQSGTVVLSNANNVSFGMAGSTVTASATVSQSTAPGGLSAGTQLATSGTVVFSNSNNVTFGMSGSSRVTASAYQPTLQRTVGYTATGGETRMTVTFTPANASSNYAVIPFLNGVSLQMDFDCPAASRSVSQFIAIPAFSLSSNDQLGFYLFQS